jgi:glutaredoxin
MEEEWLNAEEYEKSREKAKKVQSTKAFTVLVVLGAILLAVFFYSQSGSAHATYEGPQASEEFAGCISASGATFYGTSWCSHCQNQKALFGSAIEKINFVDCDAGREACSQAEIAAYPTWIIGGEKYLGMQSLQALAELTGCELSTK